MIYCPLSALQTEVYQRFRHSVLESSYNKRILYNKYASNIYGPYEKALTNVNNLLIQLRKLCNHPYLVLEDVNTIPDALYYQYLIQSSGKMYVLDKILTQLLAQNSKVSNYIQINSIYRLYDIHCIYIPLHLYTISILLLPHICTVLNTTVTNVIYALYCRC